MDGWLDDWVTFLMWLTWVKFYFRHLLDIFFKGPHILSQSPCASWNGQDKFHMPLKHKQWYKCHSVLWDANNIAEPSPALPFHIRFNGLPLSTVEYRVYGFLVSCYPDFLSLLNLESILASSPVSILPVPCWMKHTVPPFTLIYLKRHSRLVRI